MGLFDDIVHQTLLIEVAVEICLLGACIVRTETAGGCLLNLGNLLGVALDGKVGLKTGFRRERILNAAERRQPVAVLLLKSRRLYFADIVLKIMPCLILFKMHHCGNKTLAHSLGELFIPYLNDIPHIEYLYAQQAKESDSHQYCQYPDCLFLHYLFRWSNSVNV